MEITSLFKRQIKFTKQSFLKKIFKSTEALLKDSSKFLKTPAALDKELRSVINFEKRSKDLLKRPKTKNAISEATNNKLSLFKTDTDLGMDKSK